MNQSSTLKNWISLVLQKAKQIAFSHKKKLILALAILLTAIVARKTLTLDHTLKAFHAVQRIMNMLPLPEDPKLRSQAEYEHPEYVPLKGVIQAINFNDLKERIKRKQANSSNQLKIGILTGSVLSICIYNPCSILFLIQNKYREDFASLSSSVQFDEGMFKLRKRFDDQVQTYFTQFKRFLFTNFEKIQMMKQFQCQELSAMFAKSVEVIFSQKYDIRKQKEASLLSKSNPQVKNLIQSTYEYIPNKASAMTKCLTGLFNILGGCISIGSWFTQPTVQITAKRYAFVKSTYILALKKGEGEADTIKWPNKHSQTLFSLVVEQIQSVFKSVNFQTLLKTFSQFNLKVFNNRIMLFMKRNRLEAIRMAQMLQIIYKLTQQQLLKKNIKQVMNRYHDSQIKSALKKIVKSQTSAENQTQIQFSPSQENVLEEVKMKRQLQFLQKQFFLKYFNQRSKVVLRPRRQENNNEPQQMQKLLEMLGGNKALTDQQS